MLDEKLQEEDNPSMMTTGTVQRIEMALEEIRRMDLPDDETVFSIEVHQRNDAWEVDGVVGPFARTIPDGHPYSSSSCVLPSFDLAFSSKEEAMDYAKKLHDVLIEKDKGPDGPTAHLLESIQ